VRYAGRTKTELTVTEIIAIYSVCGNPDVRFLRGPKPDYLPKNKVSSKRNQKSLLFKSKKQNPIAEAKKINKFIEDHQNPTYECISEKFGVNRARISQMVSLLKNIPSEITDYVEKQSNPNFLCFFTERKLRKLTTLITDTEKIDAFRKMIASFNEKNNVSLVFERGAVIIRPLI